MGKWGEQTPQLLRTCSASEVCPSLHLFDTSKEEQPKQAREYLSLVRPTYWSVVPLPVLKYSFIAHPPVCAFYNRRWPGSTVVTDQGLSAGGEVSSCLVLSLLFSIRRGAQREWFGTRGCVMDPSEDLGFRAGTWRPSSQNSRAVWGYMLGLVRGRLQPFSYESQGRCCWETNPDVS